MHEIIPKSPVLSRRDFVKLAALGLGAIGLTGSVARNVARVAGNLGAEISQEGDWVSDLQKKLGNEYQVRDRVLWFIDSENDQEAVVFVQLFDNSGYISEGPGFDLPGQKSPKELVHSIRKGDFTVSSDRELTGVDNYTGIKYFFNEASRMWQKKRPQ